MPVFSCFQCGAQFPESDAPPQACPICEDERQFVAWGGQKWLTRDELAAKHHLVWRDDLGVPGLAMEPSFAIGQRALLLREDDGCVMWDCIPLATEAGIAHVRSLGGLKAIAISHPHYYGALADWSAAFDNAPVYLHEADSRWITRPHPAIVSWSGDRTSLSRDIQLIRGGGHFAGGTMLHWRAGAEGRGALFTGDIAMVAMDRRHLSFMYSYPNYVPLNARAVKAIAASVAPLTFDRIYGAWWERNIASGAKEAFDVSIERYLSAIA
jgi:hypothetical protein